MAVTAIMIGGIFRARECAPCSLLQFACETLRVSMTTGVAKYPVVVTSWVCSTAVCDGRFVLPSNRCNSCVSVRQQYEIAVSYCCRTDPTDNDYFIIFCLCDPLPGTNNGTPSQPDGPDRGERFPSPPSLPDGLLCTTPQLCERAAVVLAVQGLGHSWCAKGTWVEGRRSSSVVPSGAWNFWVCLRSC